MSVTSRANQNDDLVAFCGRGIVRARNEDSVAIDGEGIPQEAIVHRKLDPSLDHLAVVADGMGGHARGEVASRLTVQAVSDVWRTQRQAFDALEATQAANRAVYDAMAGESGLRGMGSTLVGLHISGAEAAWFNVGDSRGYLYRDKVLSQFTIDHVPKGATGPDGRHNHRITQAIGGGYGPQEIWPAAGRVSLIRHDIILLCSDGLTDAVPDEAIARTLATRVSNGLAASDLVRAATDGGGPDNISFVLLRRLT